MRSERVPISADSVDRYRGSMLTEVSDRLGYLSVGCRVDGLGDITTSVALSPWSTRVDHYGPPSTQTSHCLVGGDGSTTCGDPAPCWHHQLIRQIETYEAALCEQVRSRWHLDLDPRGHLLTTWADHWYGAVHVARLFDDQFFVRYRDQRKTNNWSWSGAFSGTLPAQISGGVRGPDVWHGVLLAPEVRALEPLLSGASSSVARTIVEPFAMYPVLVGDARNPDDFSPALYLDHADDMSEVRVALRIAFGGGAKFYAGLGVPSLSTHDCRVCPPRTYLDTCPHHDLRDFCRLLAPLINERRPDIERALETGRRT